MNLTLLNQQVQAEVDQRQAEIIGSVFDSLQVLHQKKAQFSDCNCSYCLALRQYVDVKLRMRRLEFRYDLTEHRKFRDDLSWAVERAFGYEMLLPELRQKKNEKKFDL